MNRILVALDVASSPEATSLADALRGTVGGFKIGKQLFTAEGPAIVQTLADRGDRVFLDLKFHDIPNTVAGAVASAVATGAWMVNVHASGGRAMLRETTNTVADFCARERLARPSILAVTVLTSMDDAALAETGVPGSAAEQVVRLAQLASECGCDGVVASPLEIELIRRDVAAENFVVLTPGIRPAGSSIAPRRCDARCP